MIGLVEYTTMQILVNFYIGNHFSGIVSSLYYPYILVSKRKFDFRDEIANNVLGSQAGETLLHELKPKYWFAAHLHCRFAATVQHNENQTTEFLALDKCLPRRQYLEV